MYYVNVDQIERRLSFIAVICEVTEQLPQAGEAHKHEKLQQFAAERAVHLAAECVTDIGSYLIDGFVMRDAGSYEDIVDILLGENVFAADLYPFLQELVRQRKPLVQEYDQLDGMRIMKLAQRLPTELPRFAQAIRTYLETELPLPR